MDLSEYEDRLKSQFADIIYVDDFFDEWGQSTATLIEEVCEHK